MSDSAAVTTTPIALVVSDVDGTLVTKEKVVTPETIQAAERLREAGIALALISSRPPAGLAAVAEQLKLSTPRSGFNGGMITGLDDAVIRRLDLPIEVVDAVVAWADGKPVDLWLFRGNDWLVDNPEGAYVAKETRTIGYGPKTVPDLAAEHEGITKIVISSAKPKVLAEGERALVARLGDKASVSLSQAYYLDVTPALANKGQGVRMLGEILLVPTSAIATIGDGENDVRMFEVSGFSVAMGNATPEVQAKASAVTASNLENGFAAAVENFILPRALRPLSE